MPINPEALDNVNALDIDSELRSFTKTLSSDIEEERNLRSDWEQRVDLWTKRRYGIRTKKNHPWPGAANFVIPLIDADINRLKPAYVNLGYGVSPIVTFEPFGAEDIEPARKREMLFDWRMRTQVEFFDHYVIGVDKALEKGSVVYKIDWHFETRTYTEILDLEESDDEIIELVFDPEVPDELFEQILLERFRPDLSLQENIDAIQDAVIKMRRGKVRQEITFTEKGKDSPRVTACDPKDDIMVPVDTTDIQQARFIDHMFWTTTNNVKAGMRDEKYVEYDDFTIKSWSNQNFANSNARQTRGLRDGTSAIISDDLILMHETWTWRDVNDDGVMERVCITWPDSSPQDVLRFIENPYDHGLFPFVQVRRELNDVWFYSSRGIPALDEDFQVGISTKFNQNVDEKTMQVPTWIHRKNSVKNLKNLRYVPGQDLEVESIDDVRLSQPQHVNQGSFFNDMAFLKSWANERLGNVSAAFSNPTNPAGSGFEGKRTKAEVQEIAQLAAQNQSLEMLVWQQQMADVYYQIDALYEQFGPEQEEILITGEQPVKISRAEIQGKFNIVPNGRLDNSNPTARFMKSNFIYRMFLNDPDVRQNELKKMLFDDFDTRLSKRLLLTPQEKQQRNQLQQASQEQLKRKLLGEQIDIRRIQDVLDIQKELAMVEIHGQKFAPN